MKGFAWLIGIVSVVAICVGIYGFWGVSQAAEQMGVNQGGIDAMLQFGDAFGAQAYTSGGEQMTYFAMMHRTNLLLFGGIGFVLSLILGKVAKK